MRVKRVRFCPTHNIVAKFGGKGFGWYCPLSTADCPKDGSPDRGRWSYRKGKSGVMAVRRHDGSVMIRIGGRTFAKAMNEIAARQLLECLRRVLSRRGTPLATAGV